MKIKSLIFGVATAAFGLAVLYRLYMMETTEDHSISHYQPVVINPYPTLHAPPIPPPAPAAKPFIVREGKSEHATARSINCLAYNIFYEAGVTFWYEKYAVAQVTMNRVNDSKWKGTVCGVVYEKGQFAWTANRKHLPKPTGKRWEQSLAVAKDVLENGATVVPLKKALFFYTPTINPPKWATPENQVLSTNNFKFYSNTVLTN